MKTTLLLIILGVAICLAILIIILMTAEWMKRSKLRAIYSSRNRDERFAFALLSHFFGGKMLKNPYILKNEEVAPARVDSIFVGSGGIALISVQNGAGIYTAPEHGAWTVERDGVESEELNLLERQQFYVSEIANILVKSGAFCPVIRRYVFLTDDNAETDYMSSENVLGGNALIEELNELNHDKRLGRKEQRTLLEVLSRNSRKIQQTLLYRNAKEAAENAALSGSQMGNAADGASDDFENS